MKQPIKSKKAIVLLSGGLDSATTLYIAKRQGYKVTCLIFDYGQRHRKELKSAKAIAKKAGAGYQLIKLSLPLRGSSLLDRKIALPKVSPILSQGLKKRKNIPSTYVPSRNLIFLSVACAFAETIGAQAIFIGANAIDYSGYPDCRPEFYRSFRKVIACGTKLGVQGRAIKILTPLIAKSKKEIIRLGMKLGVPYQLTWSCYRGTNIPCGVCESCFLRTKGFKAAGLRDPLQK